jgi:DmsE family decaheme c-type cytochrome
VKPAATILLTLAMLVMAGVGWSEDEASEPTVSRGGADSCLGCHRDPELQGVFSSAHGERDDARTPFGQLECESCHGPQGRHPMGGRESIITFGEGALTPVDEQNNACLGCHESPVGNDWHAGEHAAQDLSCASCHNLHLARDPVLASSTQADVCYECHQRQRGQAQKPYAHPVRFGRMDCSSCHAPHGSATEGSLRRLTLNETCYECHAEKRGPFAFEHQPVTEDCSLCHAPHGSNHPAMLTRRAPLLCQQCHSQQGHPSLSLTSSGLPGGSPSSSLLGGSCLNCHAQVHGSNHPSGIKQMR